MVRVGSREFAVPLWLWAAAPLALVAYTSIDLILLYRNPLYLGEPDHRFISVVNRLAAASLTGFLLADLARRARMAWYALPFVIVLALAASAFVTAWVGEWLGTTARYVVGLAIGIAASPPRGGTAFVGLALFGALALTLVALAVVVASFVTALDRAAAGLALFVRETLREFWMNLGAVTVWLALALGGYLAIRSGYGLGLGHSRDAVPRWLPVTAAVTGALLATGLQLLLTRGSRRDGSTPGRLRLWLIAPLCVGAYLYMPSVLGIPGVRAYYNYLRPALRAVHIRLGGLDPTMSWEVAEQALRRIAEERVQRTS
jgi:hypothetical protein